MNHATPPFRRTVTALLITVAVAALCGRIASVMRLYEPVLFKPESWPKTRPEPMPTHGDNDRSRWVTIRVLVDQGTYVIGHRDIDPDTGKYQDSGPMTEDGWRTIDKVMNPKTHDFYSSKPPLLTTILAGEYWLLKQGLGWSIVEERWHVIRVILLTVNALPFLLYLLLLARLAEQLGTTDWGRVFVLTAACFGTLMMPFLITLNNHTVAACTAVFVLVPALCAWSEPRSPGSAWRFAVAGFFAGLTACMELPAASFAVLLGFALFLRSPGRTLALFLPAAILPVAALAVCNYVALGQWRPAYSEFGGPWYQFEGSHWKPDSTKAKTGIDFAEEPKWAYAFHMLLGHHGLFSLTPIWLLTLARAVIPARSVNGPEGEASAKRQANLVALLTLALTLIVVSFYVWRTNNYGGWTIGLRWLIWLTPFWLLTMLPVVDWLAARRWGRMLACLLLAISVFSASYPAWNPWRQPWLYNWMEAQGWVGY